MEVAVGDPCVLRAAEGGLRRLRLLLEQLLTSRLCMWTMKASTRPRHLCGSRLSFRRAIISRFFCRLEALSLWNSLLFETHLKSRGNRLYICWKQTQRS